jgi:hypothetical protein
MGEEEYTKEDYVMILQCLNQISVTGLENVAGMMALATKTKNLYAELEAREAMAVETEDGQD